MSKKKLSLRALVLMVFTSVFGFTNVTRSYYLMGYAAIPWFIISCLTFFLPFAFMIAEYGSAFKDSEGGMYSWLEGTSGGKYAFVVTFMWYSAFIIWMVNVGSGVWVVLSNAIYGVDKTQSWSLFGLDSVKTLGILAILWIIVLTFISTKGVDKIKKFTSFGGSAVALINVFLFVGGILMLILNKGGVGDPITVNALVHSPNPAYTTNLQVLSFIVYAIFAYGGLEIVGGLVDQTENPEKNFPKGIVISAIVVSLGYSIGILIFGTFTKWSFAFAEFSSQKITLGNVSYIAMNHMGYQLGLAFGLAESAARNVGLWVSRYMGISMFLALTGAFFALIYSPLKQLIGGTPKELWPKSWTEQKNGIYTKPMIYQAICVIVIIFVVSFGGKSAQQFFQVLVSMTNVSMTLPYFFIAYSFLAFKRDDKIERPFVKFKTYQSAKVAVAVTCFIVGFANLFTVIEPAITSGDWLTTIMSIAGPLIFSLIALYLYSRMEKSKGIN